MFHFDNSQNVEIINEVTIEKLESNTLIFRDCFQ